MANKNDGIISNSYDTTNTMNNCSNNNETERSSSSTTSSSTMAITTHHNDINNQQHYHHGSLSPSSEATEDNNLCCGGGIQQQQNRKSDLESRNLGRTKNLVGDDVIGDYENIRATIRNILATAPPIEQQTRREDNPFSFKHFLNRDTNTISSATATISVTTSSTVSTASSSALATAFSNNEKNFNNSTNSNNNSHSINTEELSNSIYSKNSKNSKISNDYETDNKLPASAIITTAASSTHTIPSSSLSNSGNSSSMSNKTSTGARPKIPQSAIISSTNNININYPLHNQQQQQSSSQHQQHSLPPSSISINSMSSLIGSGGSAGESCKMKRSPRFSSFDSQASLAEYAGSGLNDYHDDRQQFLHTTFSSNYDMDFKRRNLPTKTNRSHATGLPQSSSDSKNSLGGGSGIGGPRPNSEFSNVLPDFVQDHYLDQWYNNDINLSSPLNSPISSPVDFIEDLPCRMGGSGGSSGVIGNNNGLGDLDNLPNAIEKCQTLPDFLSDGPIIHSSSARLADIATGLPPDLDSPEDNSPSLQLSRLRLENDRLRRELDESRLALAEQTRRNSELERCLEQARNIEILRANYKNKSSPNLNNKSDDENLEQSKTRDTAAQSQIYKMKQQIKQLTTEVETLKHENETLREEGAVGGDRVTKRPSRTQLSRDLMRAASNAENNLRQLLIGVENLRLMAANIENMGRIATNSTNQANLSVNDEFLSDSDLDVDDFTGPAL